MGLLLIGLQLFAQAAPAWVFYGKSPEFAQILPDQNLVGFVGQTGAPVSQIFVFRWNRPAQTPKTSDQWIEFAKAHFYPQRGLEYKADAESSPLNRSYPLDFTWQASDTKMVGKVIFAVTKNEIIAFNLELPAGEFKRKMTGDLGRVVEALASGQRDDLVLSAARTAKISKSKLAQ